MEYLKHDSQITGSSRKRKTKVWVLHRKRNKIFTGANTKTKCGAKTEGKAIQRLPHLVIHPINKSLNPDIIVDAQTHANRSLILLSPEIFCQSLTNTEVDAHSQPLY